jgi:DNA (cytosine-5)-methyltransferase 1
MRTWYEFFAGGGMARVGLGRGWKCLFANDISNKKASAYKAHFNNSSHLLIKSISDITIEDLPQTADLAWASFPCQDLSLAGDGKGLKGERSGTYHLFWDLMKKLRLDGRQPHTVVLENVVGAITSHKGADFERILTDLTNEGYIVGALVVDAVRFLPQSRPRLFIIGSQIDPSEVKSLISRTPSENWHPKSLRTAYASFSDDLKEKFVWWNMPLPKDTPPRLEDILLTTSNAAEWHTPEETRYLLSLMSDLNLMKIQDQKAKRRRVVGTAYKRGRPDGTGNTIQRAEPRFDGVAGCLRTPAGGSSRQIIIEIEGQSIRSRLLSAQEAARLMGLPENYPIPKNYNDAYHLFGDGVAVPVVQHIAKHLLNPLCKTSQLLVAAE